MIRIESHGTAVRFAVHAQPRAALTEIVGEHGGAVKIRLAAPPVQGAANTELVSFLAKTLGLSRSCVRVVRGERGRRKLVEVEGLDPGELKVRLARATPT